MLILYNIGIRAYYLLVLLASIWNPKAAKWISGRKNWSKELESVFSKSDRVIWFHCASLGEFEQGRPLIEKVRKEYPDRKILLTFFSPSGYEKRKDFSEVDHVCYLPTDTAGNAKEFLDLVPVEKVFFIKYEFWFYILRAINRKDIPVYLASGNFRADQLFFKWYGSWYKKLLGFFTHIFVQNSGSEKLLHDIGIHHVSVAGDTRFDRVAKIARDAKAKDKLLLFSNEKPVIIAGSTWEKDEELLLEIYKQFSGSCNWIIAPHEPSEKIILRLSRQFEKSVLFSKIKEGMNIEEDVIIVNTIGHLSSLYQYGTLAYIGGGFGKGIHNTLEAAAFGNPLLFGPNYHSFQEAKDLISCGAAYVIKFPQDSYTIINDVVKNLDRRKNISQIAENYIINQAGATNKIFDFVFIYQHKI